MSKEEWNVLTRNPTENFIEEILRNRGIKDIMHFLKPRESDMLPLTDLPNIDKAGEIILRAIKEGKRIHIFPDIDVDGVSSGGEIYMYLSKFTDKLSWSINKGKVHGLKGQDLESYVGKYDLLIAVDSSSEDIEQQRFLKEHGIEVIVLDHHPAKPSEYATIVNCQLGEYKNRYLSGSAVTFKFIKYLDRIQGTNFSDEYWDLATVGLIGDMMPVGEENTENRYICWKGFSSLNNVALKEIVGNYSFNGTSVSYSVAPLVNAAQRMHRNEVAFELIIEKDKRKCKKIIEKMKELRKIQNIQKDKLVEELELIIKANELDKKKAICLIVDEAKNDDQGDIVGLTANVLSAKYMLPVVIVHPTKDTDILKGSIRGYGIENFRDLINDTGLVILCQGHENASGIELYENNWEKLITAINEELEHVEFKIQQTADIILNPADISGMLIKKIEYINTISGEKFEPITVIIKDLEPEKISRMLNKHTKFEAEGMDFIQWNNPYLYEDLKCSEGDYKKVDVLGTLGISTFRGKASRQLIINDIRIETYLEFFR